MEFDTTYHEHISYLGITPLSKLFKDVGLQIIQINRQNIHGGTLRVHIAKEDSRFRPLDLSEYLNLESDYTTEYLKAWADKVKHTIKDLKQWLQILKYKNFKIAGFAASAKGNTLMNAAKIDYTTIDYIVDQTPEKIGKFSPGTGIPILDVTELINNPPDYLIILAWNFQKEIIQKCKDLGFKGKFIIPIPEFQIIENV
jgi:hypothetical protein